tara:strand:+ start:615 stop:1316 length:702 start_codon:yes stop_codon:yes gene_type:complete
MSYFRELPNLLYQSNLLHKVSSQEYIAIKNIFRRIKVRDSVDDVANFYKKYVILEGQRPDTIAEEFYGQTDLDWVVVLTSGITNIKDEWPLNNYDLNRYATEKYGTELNADHHYETLEVRDSKNRLILPAGQKVDNNFSIPASHDTSITYNIIGAYENVTYTGSGDITNITTTISNMMYETRLNEEKRNINLLKPIYLQQYLREIREIMTYSESSLFINNKLISTENTRLIGP